MFKVGQLYRFKANRDVGFEVLKKFYVKEKDRWNLKVAWVNIGTHLPWHMGIEQRIDVPASKLSEIEPIPYSFRVPAEEFAPRFIGDLNEKL